MDYIATLWVVVGIAVPFSAALGFGVAFVGSAVTPGEVRFARYCFIIPAIMLGAMELVWLHYTRQPLWWRAATGLAVGAVVFIAAPEGLRWIKNRQRLVPPGLHHSEEVNDPRPGPNDNRRKQGSQTVQPSPSKLKVPSSGGIVHGEALLGGDGAPGMDALDSTISLRCGSSARPTHSREDEPLNIVQIIGPPPANSVEDPSKFPFVASTSFMQGIGQINWGPEVDGMYYRCSLTNYGIQAVFGASVRLIITWSEVVPTQNGSTSGKIIAVRHFDSPPQDIGTGALNSNYFYIWSLSQSYVTVDFEETISLRTAAERTSRHVALIAPTEKFRPVFFLPYVPPKP